MADLSGNRFWASLPPADRKLLDPHATLVSLDHGRQLQEQSHRVEHVYFPLTGIVSLLAVMKNGAAVESAMIGAEGAAAGVGRVNAASRAVVQAPGAALRMPAVQFLKAARQSANLATRVGLYQEGLLAQIQQTAACNGLHTAEQRLSRWLLQAQDHILGDAAIPFTHEFLSNILGVRRSTVTLIATAMQRAGSIRYSRGRIQILDRGALRAGACECYDVIRTLTKERSRP